MKTNKRQILIEGRVEDLRFKYVDNPNLLPKEKLDTRVFEMLVNGDPSGNQKYLEWMTKVMVRGSTLGIGTHYVMGLVNEFHENQQRLEKKDLYQYSGYNELELALKNLQPSRGEIKRIQKQGSHKIYEDDQYLIVAPRTTEASCYYGQGTRWCTSSKRQNQFDNYYEDGTLLYIINKKEGPSDEGNYEDDYKPDYSKIALFIPHNVHENGMVYLNHPDIEVYDARDVEISEDALWSDFIFNVSEETKLKMQDVMVKYFKDDVNERGSLSNWDNDYGDEFDVLNTEGLENLIYIKSTLNEGRLEGVKETIKKILRESDFDWVSDLPAEDDFVFLELILGEPDWESVEDDVEEEPDWVYWSLYMYITKDLYRSIIGNDDVSGEWGEWNITSEEGSQLTDYFYNNDFDRKQRYSLSTEINNDMDGSFSVTDRDTFCSQVGNYHPNKCNK